MELWERLQLPVDHPHHHPAVLLLREQRRGRQQQQLLLLLLQSLQLRREQQLLLRVLQLLLQRRQYLLLLKGYIAKTGGIRGGSAPAAFRKSGRYGYLRFSPAAWTRKSGSFIILPALLGSLSSR